MITLSLEAINSHSPYRVVVNNGDYDFFTKDGIRYSASFLEDIPLGDCDTYPECFTMRFANAIVEGQGFYAAIIVENSNPKLEAIISDFNRSAESLTAGKP